jgi:hypothetical protein
MSSFSVSNRTILILNIFTPRSALSNEKETFTIYKTQLGEEHEKTKASRFYLQLKFSVNLPYRAPVFTSGRVFV